MSLSPLSLSLSPVSSSLSCIKFLSLSLSFRFFYLSLLFHPSLWYYLSLLCYRNKEGSQTLIEVETDGARPKDLKMQMTVNKEIYSVEKINLIPRSSLRPTNKKIEFKACFNIFRLICRS